MISKPLNDYRAAPQAMKPMLRLEKAASEAVLSLSSPHSCAALKCKFAHELRMDLAS